MDPGEPLRSPVETLRAMGRNGGACSLSSPSALTRRIRPGNPFCSFSLLQQSWKGGSWLPLAPQGHFTPGQGVRASRAAIPSSPVNTREQASIEADSRLFSRTIREVRLSPERFASGLTLIADKFSVETRRAQAQAELDKFDENGPVERSHPLRAMYQQVLESASDPMLRIGALRGFVESRPLSLDRTEAQAVLLVVAWVADDDPDYTVGLPALLESWIVDYWAGRDDANRAQRVEEQRALLRFLRHGLGHDVDWRRRLSHVATLAWDRMDTISPDFPQDQQGVSSSSVESAAKPATLASSDPKSTQVPAVMVEPPLERVRHADDFSWMIVGKDSFKFTKGQQSGVIKALFEAWERSGRRDGHGLSEETLGAKVHAVASIRVMKVFQDHPALDTILRRAGKGVWALHLGNTSEQSSPGETQ